jgi:hypothetical protein
MPLSDVAIRKAKTTDKAQRLFDRFGLYVEVTPAARSCGGQKYRFGGKEKRLAHGSYPAVTLAEARERRDEARKLLSKGLDRADNRRAVRQSRTGRKQLRSHRQRVAGRADLGAALPDQGRSLVPERHLPVARWPAGG